MSKDHSATTYPFLPLDARITKDAVLVVTKWYRFRHLATPSNTAHIYIHQTHYKTNANVLFVVHLAPLSSNYTRHLVTWALP